MLPFDPLDQAAGSTAVEDPIGLRGTEPCAIRRELGGTEHDVVRSGLNERWKCDDRTEVAAKQLGSLIWAISQLHQSAHPMRSL